MVVVAPENSSTLESGLYRFPSSRRNSGPNVKTASGNFLKVYREIDRYTNSFLTCQTRLAQLKNAIYGPSFYERASHAVSVFPKLYNENNNFDEFMPKSGINAIGFLFYATSGNRSFYGEQ